MKRHIIMALLLCICLFGCAAMSKEAEKVSNNTSKEPTMEELVDEATLCIDRYNNGELTYDEALEAILTIQGWSILPTQAIESMKEDLADLHQSKANFEFAEVCMSRQRYLEAMECYAEILEKDSLYSKAGIGFERAKKEYIGEEMKKAEAAYASKDYRSAINILKTCNDNLDDEAPEVQNQAIKYGLDYVSDSLQRAKDDFDATGDYYNALSILQITQADIPFNDSNLQAAIELYSSYIPIQLKEMVTFAGTGNSEIEYKVRDITDNFGNTYHSYYYIFGNESEEYYMYALNGKYDVLYGVIFIGSEEKNKNCGYIEINGDGKPLFISNKMQPGAEPQEFRVSVTGIAHLEFRFYGGEKSSNLAYYEMPYLTNVVFEKSIESIADAVTIPDGMPLDGSSNMDQYTEESIQVGIILDYDENHTDTYKHIEGITAAMESIATPIQAEWRYNITDDGYTTAVDLIKNGASIIIANNGFMFERGMIRAAADYPNASFIVYSGSMANVCGLKNITNVYPRLYEARYVAGVVAGKMLQNLMDFGHVEDPYIGYVEAYGFAEAISSYTAFFLGVRSVVPDAHMEVMYTGSWHDPDVSYKAAEVLMEKGCAIIGQGLITDYGVPLAVQQWYERGKMKLSIGYFMDFSLVAPDSLLTSVLIDFNALYTDAIKSCLKDTPHNDRAPGYGNGVMISDLARICDDETAEAAQRVIGAIQAGTLHPFDTSTFTVDGKTVDSYFVDFSVMNADYSGIEYVGEKRNVIANGYFNESDYRSFPYFDLHIDGITE